MNVITREDKMKRGGFIGRRTHFILAGLFLVLIISSFVSAGFFDWFKKTITGEASSSTTNLNITVGVAPQIVNVTPIGVQSVTENGVTSVFFNFTVQDSDGAGTINRTSATGLFNRTGETDRTNTTCTLVGTIGTIYATFSCIIGLQYFDGAGAWGMNVTIKDNSSNFAQNVSNNFTVNALTAMVMYPTALTWASVAVTDTNVLSNNDPIRINNTGNANSTGLLVEVTAIDMRGEATPSQALFAGNFTVDETNACDAGPAMVNNTAVRISGALLPKGNNSVNNGTEGQEDVYFCLEALNAGLSSQSYSTSRGGPWTIAVV